jgi:hypothetical protein
MRSVEDMPVRARRNNPRRFGHGARIRCAFRAHAAWPPPAGRTGSGVSLRQNYALDPGFIAFRLARRTRIVVLMVPV